MKNYFPFENKKSAILEFELEERDNFDEEFLIRPDQEAPTECPKCKSKNIVPEPDIINTWATSSLTPTIVKELFKDKPVYNFLVNNPMNLRPQGHDIISFWLFNTVVKSQFHYNMNPWNECFINGWMLDSKGKKMSKSKGNVVEPQTMIEKYSADALRFMSGGCKLGEDLPFPEKDILTGQKFVNKLWNASKFSIMHLKDYQKNEGHKKYEGHERNEVIEVFDKWVLSKLNKLIKECTESFEKYEFSKVKADVEKFFWHTFCGHYLEIVKDRLYNPNKRGESAKKSAQQGVYQTILSIIKMVAPIMPHITEEIYHLYFTKKEDCKSIHLSKWPLFEPDLVDEKIELAGDLGADIINTVRKFKSEQNFSIKENLRELILVNEEKGFLEMIKSIEEDLKAVLTIEEIKFAGDTTLESEKFLIKIGIKK